MYFHQMFVYNFEDVVAFSSLFYSRRCRSAIVSASDLVLVIQNRKVIVLCDYPNEKVTLVQDASRCPLSIPACPSIHPFVSTNDLEQRKEEAVTAALRAVHLYLKLRLRRLQLHPHIIPTSRPFPPALIRSQSSLGPSIYSSPLSQYTYTPFCTPHPFPPLLPGHTPTHRSATPAILTNPPRWIRST